MTTEELADSLGVARQTVNRWIRQKGWKTEGINGVKGGRARVICIDAHVKEHIISLPAIRNRRAVYHVAESPSHYGVATSSSLLPQIIDSLENMTTVEQERLRALLAREGLKVFSRVSVLLNNRHKKRQVTLPFFVLHEHYCWLSRSAINPSALLIRATLRDLPIA